MANNVGLVRAAVVQSAGCLLDRDGAISKAEALIAEAGHNSAEIVIFPEGFIPAHPLWFHFHSATSKRGLELATKLFRNAVVVGGPETDRLCAAARAAGTWVVIGVCEKLANTTGTMWNTALHISPEGRIVAKHRKLTPTVGERLVHSGGGSEGLQLPRARFGTVGSLVCAENSNPLLVFSVIAQYAAVHAALWPNHFSPTQPRMRDIIMTAARAIAYQAGCYVLNAAGTVTDSLIEQIAKDDEDRTWLHDPANVGGSCIVAPSGELVTPQAGMEETVLYGDLDLDVAVAKRAIHDFAGHYNRGDLLSLVIHPTSGKLFQAPWQTAVESSPTDVALPQRSAGDNNPASLASDDRRDPTANDAGAPHCK